MKAFWWFKDNEIAGMARPGFNNFRWFDLTLEEAIVVGWIGQFPSGETLMQDFSNHVDTYGRKVAMFYKLSAEDAIIRLQSLKNATHLEKILNDIKRKYSLFVEYSADSKVLSIEFCNKQLARETAFLKQNKIATVVSLTERHNSKDHLQQHFLTRHFSINDLDAPKDEHVAELASIIDKARTNDERIAVHCLAGIGRTSTIIMAAHMHLGHKLDDLLKLIEQKNPVYVFTGKQAEYLNGLKKRLLK